MVSEQVIETYSEKEDIDSITKRLENVKYEDLKKSDYYELSLLHKNTNEEDVKRTYPQFDRVKLINVRKLKYGDLGYDLHYELDDGTFFLIAICIDKKELINAFHAKKDFKKFKKSLIKSYGRKF